MTVKDLQNDPSYSLLLVLPHDEIMPFVEKQFFSKTVTIRAYLLMNILLLVIIIALAALDIWHGHLGFWGIVKYFGIGTLLVFTLLIPVHEGLHGLAYKISGATNISFGVNWRMFYFYAVADQFITDRKSFVFVALLPFAVISILTVGFLFFVPIAIKWVLLGTLAMHTAACAGDFAMLGFYEQYRHVEELLTYDDVAKKQSYFYVRE